MYCIVIAKDRAYLDKVYRAMTWDKRVAAVDNYVTIRLDMTADIKIKDKNDYFVLHPQSHLEKHL